MYAGKLVQVLAWSQGVYYLVTGVWPLVSVESFEAVTGKKSDHLIAKAPTEADHWMLYTISGLILAVAVAILTAAWRRQYSLEVIVLAITSALALSVIDVVYVARGTILPIYLADAAVEIVIIVAWSWLALRRGERPSPEAPSLH